VGLSFRHLAYPNDPIIYFVVPDSPAPLSSGVSGVNVNLAHFGAGFATCVLASSGALFFPLESLDGTQ
jgi:hypothetical protein